MTRKLLGQGIFRNTILGYVAFIQLILRIFGIDTVNAKSLDLNLLVVFDVLMRERNVTRAGMAVSLTQPSMSNALARLRRHFDDPLFIRSPRGMEPTALAKQLAPSISEGLDTIRRGLEEPMGFRPGESKRTFRLLMSDVAEVTLLPFLMRALKQEAPNAKVRVLPIAREHYGAMLDRDEADLAIGNLTLGDHFYQQRLFEDRYVCLGATKSHGVQSRIALRDYLSAQHVRVTSSRGDALVEDALVKRGLARSISLELANFLAVPLIVMHSELLVTLPSTAHAMLPFSEAVSSYTLPFSIPRANVRQYWHLRYHQDPALQWLRSKLLELGPRIADGLNRPGYQGGSLGNVSRE